ncbi:hypothetical protein [Micromonospora schwarzwaldensis]|uniref:hypothetical protein n=1 Tax=Micromonospora sp. DSM 45708 TaxID=3111767 RepID=UPI0031D72D3A
MSATDERSALDHPVSLFEHARRLHLLTPRGPLPDGGQPLPDNGDHPNTPSSERKQALLTVLRVFISNPALSPQDLHEQCTHLAFGARAVTRALQELAPEVSPRLLQTARWLVMNGTDRRAVLLGLGLFDGNAEQSDADSIRTIGLLRFAERPAIEALAKIPTAAQDLIWLAERSRNHSRTVAAAALAGHPDPAVRQWVLSTPRDLLSSDLARQIAERYSLAETLGRPVVDDRTWDQAGNLLLAMTSTRNYRYEINRYDQAAVAYQRWVALAGTRPATLERAALLTMIAEDLRTGPAAPVACGIRQGLIDQINDVLTSAPWTDMLNRSAGADDPIEARRAAWIIDQTARNGVPEQRFAIRVVVPDPSPAGFPQIEARIIIAGMPIVATIFDKGPAEEPERLIYSGRLRATTEPKEVRLAEAYCTEGCCGGLYVTIVRDGPEVIWKDWRSSTPGDPPPEMRFDATQYDREIIRAEQDHTWEWPARTLARRVADRLRADPTILNRWDCAPGWCTAWLKEYDLARLTFNHPARTNSFSDPSIQFGLVVDVYGQDPDLLATEIIESMKNVDPKSTAEMIGGSKDTAEKLGLAYRKPNRW